MTPSSDPSCREAVLQGYVRQILLAGHPQAVLLFGSSARGTANADSDFDWLVVEDTPLRPTQRGLRYRLAMHPRTIPVDLVVRTPDEIRKALTEGRSFLSEVVREGRVIYGHL